MIKNKFIRFRYKSKENFCNDCKQLLEKLNGDLERFESLPFTKHSPYKVRREYEARLRRLIKSVQQLIQELPQHH